MFALLTALVGSIIGFFSFWRFWFFLRDPKRRIPPGHSVLAAADGLITYVKRAEAGQIPIAVKGRRKIPLSEYTHIDSLSTLGDGWLVGTFMTAFSVHRNRAPVSGQVVYKQHVPAQRANLSTARMMTNLTLGRRPYDSECEYLLDNERMTLAIQTEQGTVVVTQIADAWIDRIVARPEVGDQVERGSQYGMIRFGSHVDLFIPDTLGMRVIAEAGSYVRAGESVIAVAKAEDNYRIREATTADNNSLIDMVCSNPIVMDVSYVMDRSPDFMTLHKLYPGSRVLLAEVDPPAGPSKADLPLACLSDMNYSCRIRDDIVPMRYITDMNRRPNAGPADVATALVGAAVRNFVESDAALLTGLINKTNVRALRLASRGFAVQLTPLAEFSYIEIPVLWPRRFSGKATTDSAPDPSPALESDLAEAVEFTNEFYATHELYVPLSVPYLHWMVENLPGFTWDDIIVERVGQKICGVAITYDPSPLVNIYADRYDAMTKATTLLVDAAHRFSRAVRKPPHEGEVIRTLQLRYFAYTDNAVARRLLTAVTLHAYHKDMHTVSLMLDIRQPLPVRVPFALENGSVMFAAKNPSAGLDLDAVAPNPLFFDITLG